jgi:hypothetical protein
VVEGKEWVCLAGPVVCGHGQGHRVQCLLFVLASLVPRMLVGGKTRRACAAHASLHAIQKKVGIPNMIIPKPSTS